MAWHIAEKKMCKVQLINFDGGAFLVGVDKEDDYLCDGGKSYVVAPTNGRFCDFDEFELMQYTGLKDKNGVEIYEGDIVKWSHLGGEKYVIYYNESECHFFAKPTDEDEIESYLDSTHMEYVGNIHENPELL